MVAVLAGEVKHQGDQRRTGALPKQTRGSQHAAGTTAAMARRGGDNGVVVGDWNRPNPAPQRIMRQIMSRSEGEEGSSASAKRPVAITASPSAPVNRHERVQLSNLPAAPSPWSPAARG
jgi:hypothetical protein